MSSSEDAFQDAFQTPGPPEPPPIVIADSWFEEQAGAGLSKQEGSKHGDSGSAEQRYMDKLVKFYSIYNPGTCTFPASVGCIFRHNVSIRLRSEAEAARWTG